MKTLSFAPTLSGLIAALLASPPSAHAWRWFDDTSRPVVAVNSVASPGYVRQKTSGGQFVPEPVVFVKGSIMGQFEQDPSFDHFSFRQVVRAIAGPLSARGYVPGKSVDDLKLAIVVSWGKTQGSRNDPRVRNQMIGDPEVIERIDIRNAALLGYSSALQDSFRHQRTALAVFDSAIIGDELEINRYFVVLRAYDYPQLRRDHRASLLWEARYSIDEKGNDFAAGLGAMTREAASYFGRDSDGLRHREVPEGEVHIGRARVVP